MGKRKGIRLSYPDSAPSIPSTSIRIHRTASNRISGRTYVQQIQEAPVQPAETPAAPEEATTDNPWSESFFASGNNDTISLAHDNDMDSTTAPTVAASRPPRFLEDYLQYRQGILDQIIEHDGRLGSRLCHDCAVDEGIYRCQDCLYPGLYCATCMADNHMKTPFHRILVC